MRHFYPRGEILSHKKSTFYKYIGHKKLYEINLYVLI